MNECVRIQRFASSLGFIWKIARVESTSQARRFEFQQDSFRVEFQSRFSHIRRLRLRLNSSSWPEFELSLGSRREEKVKFEAREYYSELYEANSTS